MDLDLDFRPAAATASALEIVESIRAGGRPLVALSGGTDSAVVAFLAHRADSTGALAVTLVGSAVSDEERWSAAAAANAIGIAHQMLAADPIEDESYRNNPKDRCYHCRRVETRALREFGNPRGFAQFLDGVHRDDLADDRPGLRAMAEAGFLHPLLEAGWGKTDVRLFGQRAGLPNWARPANACLASRVASGEPISSELLGRVERAERTLLVRGFERVRVRVSHNVARVVVGSDEVARLLREPDATEIRTSLAQLGFENVILDVTGYRGPTAR